MRDPERTAGLMGLGTHMRVAVDAGPKGPVIGLDLGGTKILGLLLDEAGVERARVRRAVEGVGNQAVYENVLAVLRVLMDEARVAKLAPVGIGIGVPGYAETRTGIVRDSTNLQVRDLPLGSMLFEALGVPVRITHDVRAAALAEARLGAGVGAGFLAFLNVGTGVSVGLILGGAEYTGAAERAGEIGHICMRPDGPRCPCGLVGCLEVLSSGPALAAQARQRIAEGRRSAMVGLVDHALDRITAEVVARAAREGDDLALELIRTAAGYLAQATVGLVHVLDLECVIVGGGLAQMGATLLDPFGAAVERFLLDEYRASLRIVPARLGSDAGAIGAALAVSSFTDS